MVKTLTLLVLFAAVVARDAHGRVEGAAVVEGRARFTVITPTLIRMEFSSTGAFVDRRSYFAWERQVPPPPYETRRDADGALTITTARMALNWRGGDGFDAQNLSIRYRNHDGAWKTWRPGDRQTGNLGGALRSLDGCSGPEPLPDGVVSRDGWYLLEDRTFLVDDGPEPSYQVRPASESADWYFFGYGDGDYEQALRDLTTVSGRVPMPPRYVLGVMRSRNYSYSADEYKQFVLDYDTHHFPLDVMVMDTGWHVLPPHNGWADWNYRLIPDPHELLDWLHGRGLRVTMNWQPDGGVSPKFATGYADFARAVGADPSAGKQVPFAEHDRRYMQTYFEKLMDPVAKLGVDFWWLDGAQDLAWVNALLYNDVARISGGRGVSFSRWGGWGNQRYPISFTADTSSFWRVLRFSVPYTAAAGNTGADYLSNDLGGFRLKNPSAELYLRWVQFGALSPIMRTHGSNHGTHGAYDYGDFREPWQYGPQVEAAARRAYDLRSQLFPYLYTCAYQCWKDSLPLVRPLYLNYPSAEEAYTHPAEYQFGPSLLVAPIVNPGIGRAWLGAAEVWFPGGTWWNLLTDESVSRPGGRPVLADADEIPVFAKGGTPLPLQRTTLRMASKPDGPLIVRIYPGERGEFSWYEDDGMTDAYQQGAGVLTPLRYESRKDGTVRIEIGPASGHYDGQPARRDWVVELPVTTAPASVAVNGASYSDSSYDPVRLTAAIRLHARAAGEPVIVDVRFQGSPEVRALLPEIVNRIARTRRALSGGGESLADWKVRATQMLFHLETLRTRASQALGPVGADAVAAGLRSVDEELAETQTGLPAFRDAQAQAAAFALSGAFVSTAIEPRHAVKGFVADTEQRYYRKWGQANDLAGYTSGVVVRALIPPDAARATLAIDLPGLTQERVDLPAGRTGVSVFLPFADAGQHPLCDFSGSVSLEGVWAQPISRGVRLQTALLEQWSVAGPFAPGQVPVAVDSVLSRASLQETYPGAEGTSVSWQSWQAAVVDKTYVKRLEYLTGIMKWVDLEEIYPGNRAAAVAATWIHVAAPVDARLALRHRDGAALWLNRRPVLASADASGVTDLFGEAPETVPIRLKAGWNQILLKTEHAGDDWGFQARLELPMGVVVTQSAVPP